jgi:hypothetical protein
MNRYDSRYQREYLRAHRRFLEVRDRRTPPTTAPLNSPPPVIPPAEPEPPVPEESVVSKGTPEVIENTPALPQARCAAGTNQAAQKRQAGGYRRFSGDRRALWYTMRYAGRSR